MCMGESEQHEQLKALASEMELSKAPSKLCQVQHIWLQLTRHAICIFAVSVGLSNSLMSNCGHYHVDRYGWLVGPLNSLVSVICLDITDCQYAYGLLSIVVKQWQLVHIDVFYDINQIMHGGKTNNKDLDCLTLFLHNVSSTHSSDAEFK